jgi:hypothetical protein
MCADVRWSGHRRLWDGPRTHIAIVFVGGGYCYRVLKREPMLSSRVYVWQEFRRLTREQILDVIPVYLPVWADVDAELIAYADTHAGRPLRGHRRIAPHLGRDTAALVRPTRFASTPGPPADRAFSPRPMMSHTRSAGAATMRPVDSSGIPVRVAQPLRRSRCSRTTSRRRPGPGNVHAAASGPATSPPGRRRRATAS